MRHNVARFAPTAGCGTAAGSFSLSEASMLDRCKLQQTDTRSRLIRLVTFRLGESRVSSR